MNKTQLAIKNGRTVYTNNVYGSTNWILYMIEFTKYASGFDFDMYNNGIGIKKIKIKK